MFSCRFPGKEVDCLTFMHSLRFCHWDVWHPGRHQLPVLQRLCPENRWVRRNSQWLYKHQCRRFWPICALDRRRSMPVNLAGNASQKRALPLQEARHNETWSSGVYCVGYPVGSLRREPLFNPTVAWCTQCHPVCGLKWSKCENIACVCVFDWNRGAETRLLVIFV